MINHIGTPIKLAATSTATKEAANHLPALNSNHLGKIQPAPRPPTKFSTVETDSMMRPAKKSLDFADINSFVGTAIDDAIAKNEHRSAPQTETLYRAEDQQYSRISANEKGDIEINPMLKPSGNPRELFFGVDTWNRTKDFAVNLYTSKASELKNVEKKIAQANEHLKNNTAPKTLAKISDPTVRAQKLKETLSELESKRDGLKNVQIVIKEISVNDAYTNYLRATSVSENDVKVLSKGNKNSESTIYVDISKAKDQFGLRTLKHLQTLNENTVPGSFITYKTARSVVKNFVGTDHSSNSYSGYTVNISWTIGDQKPVSIAGAEYLASKNLTPGKSG